MNNDSSDKNNGNSFEYKLKEVSDEEIVNILMFREHFQPHAVKEAIKEALKRGLINSIEDLESERFQKRDIEPRSFFPLGTNKAQTLAIFKSVCRIAYGIGLLPVIYGIVQLNNHQIIEGITTILIGLLVFFVTNRLEKTKKTQYANLLLFFNIPAISYATYYIITHETLTTMDKVAILIVVFVILYISIYAKKMSLYFNRITNNES